MHVTGDANFDRVFTLLIVYTPIGQFLHGLEPEWEALYGLGPALYFWYMFLAPVRRVSIESDGEVVFVTGLGTKRAQAVDIRGVRPFFFFSSQDFVLRFADGWVLLFGDPTLVSVLTADLRELNPQIRVLGVPDPPGSRGRITSTRTSA